MALALGSDEPQQNKGMKDLQVPLPQRDHVTSQQLSTLLQTAAALYPVLLNHDPDTTSKNGGAYEAAEATFLKICDRIDGIIDDGDRWSLNTHRTLEAQLSQLYQDHTNLIRSQQAATQLLAAPHTIHKPQLMYLEADGLWLAVLGKLEDPKNAIVAAGKNPAEAMMAWDLVFTGQMASQKLELQPDPKPRKKHGKK